MFIRWNSNSIILRLWTWIHAPRTKISSVLLVKRVCTWAWKTRWSHASNRGIKGKTELRIQSSMPNSLPFLFLQAYHIFLTAWFTASQRRLPFRGCALAAFSIFRHSLFCRFFANWCQTAANRENVYFPFLLSRFSTWLECIGSSYDDSNVSRVIPKGQTLLPPALFFRIVSREIDIVDREWGF